MNKDKAPILNLIHHFNDHDGVSNHQPHGYLLNRLFGRRSKKTSKLCVTGLCAGSSPGPVNSPHKGPVTRKIFPFDDVIMLSESPASDILVGRVSFLVVEDVFLGYLGHVPGTWKWTISHQFFYFLIYTYNYLIHTIESLSNERFKLGFAGNIISQLFYASSQST